VGVAETCGKPIQEIMMKARALMAVAVAGALWSAGSIANQQFSYGMNNHIEVSGPASVSEAPAGMSTILSLDNRTGGYKGWGPMPNPHTAASADESMPLAQIDEEREYRQHLAEVNSHREQVWVANAPLRAEYENIGATRSEAGGFGRFFSR
jgi:hypothetical protein